MNYDLIKIKEKYGEKMMHLCRTLFPTLLEKEGLLFNLLKSKFAYSKFLCEDIINNNLESTFKDYIYSFFDIVKEETNIVKSPQELLADAGYDFYECNTEEDVQSFKKYYKNNEKLCTFRGGRLNYCYVFFAIKKNVEEIKRENFPIPARQDEYGTSVISIQFSRGKNNTLSIKNRYNHTVQNPDATFSNNLENIIPGLTKSFEHFYNLNIEKNKYKYFELPGYVKANDGKLYKYNYEMNNIYYCPNNVIIDNFQVINDYEEKEKYLVLDYFVIDLINKKISLYDKTLEDSFTKYLNNIKKIEINKLKGTKNKLITLTLKNGSVAYIEIDKYNTIKSFKNDSIVEIYEDFLYNNKYLEEISLSNVKYITDRFLYKNKKLKKLNIPNIIQLGNFCLYDNQRLTEINFPTIKKIGTRFLFNNTQIQSLNIPEIVEIGHDFFQNNTWIEEFNAPKLLKIGDNFFKNNNAIKNIMIPKVISIGNGFLESNNNLDIVEFPNLEYVGDRFLYLNNKLTRLETPNLKIVKNKFLNNNNSLIELNFPNLVKVGNDFLRNATKLKRIYLPQLNSIEDHFLSYNNIIQELDFPNLRSVGKHFLYNNNSLIKLNAPVLYKVGDKFLYYNTTLKNINIPSLQICGKSFCKKKGTSKKIKFKIKK